MAEKERGILLIEERSYRILIHCGEAIPEDALKEVGLELDHRCIAARVECATLFASSSYKNPF